MGLAARSEWSSRLAIVTAAILAAASGVIFALWVPPFVDLPQHALTAAMLRHPEVYGETFVSQFVPWSTNSLWFTVDRVLAWVLRPDQSVVLGAWLAVIGLPLALAAWARVRGGDPLVALLLGWGLAWTRPLYWGFLHYALSLSVGVLVLALDVALLRSESVSRRIGLRIAVAIGCVVAFLLHAQTTAFVVGALGLQRLLLGVTPQRAFLRTMLELAALLVPCLALFGVWVAETLIAPSEAAMPLGTLTGGLGWVDQPLGERLERLPGYLGAPFRWTTLDDLAIGLVCVLGLVGLGLSLRSARGDRERLALWASAVGIAGTGLMLYLFMPLHIQGQYYLSARMAPWMLLPLVPCAAVQLAGRLRLVLLSGALFAAVASTVTAWQAFEGFGREAAPVDALLADVEEEQQTMLWATSRSSRVAPNNPFTHYLAWHASRTRGTTAFSFASFLPNPVVYRTPDTAARSVPGEEFKGWCTAFAGRASEVGYVVVRQTGERELACDVLATYDAFLEPVAEQGAWRLLRVLEPLPAQRRACRCPTGR